MADVPRVSVLCRWLMSPSLLNNTRREDKIFTDHDHRHPQSPCHFAWQPSARVLPNVLSTCLRHLTTAAT